MWQATATCVVVVMLLSIKTAILELNKLKNGVEKQKKCLVGEKKCKQKSLFERFLLTLHRFLDYYARTMPCPEP